MDSINKYIDHTLLTPEATTNQIYQLCEEARTHKFAAVCIAPTFVKEAFTLLKDTEVKTCTVVGFPLGSTLSSVKAFETRMAIDQGATEIDMVANISALKDKDWKKYEDDIHSVLEAASGRIVKVIIETCLLTNDEIIKACQAVLKANAHFIKTSTGFSKSGATVETVKLIKQTVEDKCLIKASGGIKSYEFASKLISSGANRIGTSQGINLLPKD